MDYSKLLHVTDSLSGGRQESVAAPKVKASKKNPLDSMEVVNKIIDSTPAPAPNYKVVILDDAQIIKIMTAPRDSRRKLISRLTDSQRRRVLTRYRELTRVQDDDSDATLQLFALDGALNNYLFSPDEYNLGILDKATASAPAELSEFIQAVKDQDRAKVVDLLPSYKEYLAAQGVNSDIQLADELSESAPVGDSVSEEAATKISAQAQADVDAWIANPKSDPFEQSDKSIADLVNSGAGDYASVEDLYVEAWNAAFGEHQSKLSDSHLAQLQARRVMDDVIDQIAEKPYIDDNGEEFVPTEERPILEVLSEALANYLDGDDSLLKTIASTDLSGDVVNPVEESEAEVGPTVSDIDTDEPEDAAEESTDELNDVVPEPTDEAEVDEDNKDKDEDKESDKVGDSFTAEGLQHEAADITEVMEDIKVNNEKEDEEYAKDLRKLAKDMEDQSHVTVPHNSDVFDSVQLAQNILNKVYDNVLVRKLTPKVPTLQKFNFIQDCDVPFYTIPDPQVGVANPPLSREEYYTIAPQVPDYFPLVVASYPAPQCPSCCEVTPSENCVCANVNGCQQNYYPYNCTMQEIADLLGTTDSAHYADVINAHCAPMNHVFHLAALTNNLSVIDSRFYKKHLSDSEWYFDEVPACLNGIAQGPGSIQIVRDSDNAISLYGVKFIIK